MLGYQVGIGLFQWGSSSGMANLIRPERLLMPERGGFGSSLIRAPAPCGRQGHGFM